MPGHTQFADDAEVLCCCEAREEMKACTDLVLHELGRALLKVSKKVHRFAHNMTGPLPIAFLQTQAATQIGRTSVVPSQAQDVPSVTFVALVLICKVQAAVRLSASEDAFPRIVDLIQELMTSVLLERTAHACV